MKKFTPPMAFLVTCLNCNARIFSGVPEIPESCQFCRPRPPVYFQLDLFEKSGQKNV